jgi:hypothetical protein
VNKAVRRLAAREPAHILDEFRGELFVRHSGKKILSGVESPSGGSERDTHWRPAFPIVCRSVNLARRKWNERDSPSEREDRLAPIGVRRIPVTIWSQVKNARRDRVGFVELCLEWCLRNWYVRAVARDSERMRHLLGTQVQHASGSRGSGEDAMTMATDGANCSRRAQSKPSERATDATADLQARYQASNKIVPSGIGCIAHRKSSSDRDGCDMSLRSIRIVIKCIGEHGIGKGGGSNTGGLMPKYRRLQRTMLASHELGPNAARVRRGAGYPTAQ